MPDAPPPHNFLLTLAAEGIAPVIGGCAGALAGGSAGAAAGAVAGLVVGQVVERAINFFGQRIAYRWLGWLRTRPRDEQVQAIAGLAALPAEQARREAQAAVERVAPDASVEDKTLAIEYLSAIPAAVQRSLVRDRLTGALTLPATLAPDNGQALLRLLPADVPPYAPGSALPGTPYRLEELLGTGGFGAVYRASDPALQYLSLAIKFCLDPSMAAVLHRERNNLDRLMNAGKGDWTPGIVRLYGYNLDHPTPFLVYEYVPGGDLTSHLAARMQETGRPPSAQEVLGWVMQIAAALAFAHERGLVHHDLKPANVLLGADGRLKLADFGIGSPLSGATEAGHGGSSLLPYLSVLEQASLFRGAGTPLYMSQEQKRNEPPDPRHDLYSLGVLWYQLLVGDVTRELHPGWAKELEVKFRVPAEQVALLQRCVGWIDDRPRDAGELLTLLRPLAESAAAPPAVPSGNGAIDERFRSAILLAQLKKLQRLQFWLTREAWHIGTTFAVVLGVVLGILTGSICCAVLDAAANRSTSPFTFTVSAGVGLLIFVVCVVLGVRADRRTLARLRRAVADKIARIVEGFPEAVKAWGGPGVLEDEEVVREIIRVLENGGGGRRS
jgi:hypothetical protein